MYRSVSLLVAIALAFSLFGGGLAHATVPHDEGDHHSQKETVWNTLHASLSHEQKFFVLAGFACLFTLGAVLAAVAALRDRSLQALVADRRHTHLRRGVALYRRFS